MLDEGSVVTAAFGLVCLGSLATPKPLMYRLAMEFVGPDTAKGREFTGLWQYAEFRHVFRVMTIVWGIGYLAEAAARVVIVQNTSTGTALAISKVMPYAVAAVLTAWTVGYGRYRSARASGWPPRRKRRKPRPPPVTGRDRRYSVEVTPGAAARAGPNVPTWAVADLLSWARTLSAGARALGS